MVNAKFEEADGAAKWWDIDQLFAGKRMKYEFVGCGCPGIIDGLCRRDLEGHRPWGSTADLLVHSFAGLDSVLVEAGKGQGSQPIISEALRCGPGVPARVERECGRTRIFNMAGKICHEKRSPRAIKFNK